MIQCTDIRFRIDGRLVLDGCGLHVPEGAHVLLTGPSGAGKTTLLRLIAGLETPEAGEIRLRDRLVAAKGTSLVPGNRRAVGLVFQDLGLWPSLTVRQHLEGVLHRSGLAHEERLARVRSTLDDFRLTGLEERRPAQLSGGEQQRLALARGLVVRPHWLLLDEPFAGLDLVLRLELSALVRALHRRWGLTLVTVSHQPSDALNLGVDYVAVLEDSRVVESFVPGDPIIGPPKSRTRAAWMAGAGGISRASAQRPA